MRSVGARQPGSRDAVTALFKKLFHGIKYNKSNIEIRFFGFNFYFYNKILVQFSSKGVNYFNSPIPAIVKNS